MLSLRKNTRRQQNFALSLLLTELVDVTESWDSWAEALKEKVPMLGAGAE